LHELGIDLSCVREDGELVAGECAVGEDIDDDVSKRGDRTTLSLAQDRNPLARIPVARIPEGGRFAPAALR